MGDNPRGNSGPLLLGGVQESSRDLPLHAGNNGVQAKPVARHGIDFRGMWEMTSMTLGVGIFAIPFVFQTLGLIQGIIWVVVCGFFAEFSMQRLLDIAAAHGAKNYSECVELTLGKPGKTVLLTVLTVTPFIGTLSYLSATRTLLLEVLVAFLVEFDVNTAPEGITILSGWKLSVVLALQMAVFLPMNMNTDMSGHTSIAKMAVFTAILATLVFAGYCMVLLFIGCGNYALCGSKATPLFGGSVLDILRYPTTIAFSFSMVLSMFPVMKDRIVDGDVAEGAARMRHVVRWSVVICCTLYLTIGVFGAITLRDKTQPVALNNLSMSHPLIQLLILIVGVSMTRVCSIISLPIFQTMEALTGPSRADKLRPWFLVGFGALWLVVDAAVPTAIAFALTGSLGLATCAYVMPALVFLKAPGRPPAESSDSGFSAKNNLISGLSLCFGLYLLLVGTSATVVAASQNTSSGHPIPLQKALCHQA